MRHTFFASTALLACLTLPALAADAPAAPAAPAAAPAPAPAAVAAPAAAADDSAPTPELGVQDSVLRLLTDREVPTLGAPWKVETPAPSVNTGVSVSVGGKNYVLAAANTATFAVKITGPDKAEFSLVAQSPALQLALFEIKDAAKSAAFFKAHPPLALATDAPVAVGVLGRTANEKDLDLVRGMVTVTTVTNYGTAAGLKSAANLQNPPDQLQVFFKNAMPGPVIDDKNKLAGYYSGLEQSEDKKNTFATFVPTSELKTFLADAATGHCEGKWSLKTSLRNAINIKPLVNEALRAKLNLKDETAGVLITGQDGAMAPFKPWDVLTAVGSHAIKDNLGNAAIDPTLNGSIMYFINEAANAATQTVPVKVLRDGKSVSLDLPVTRHEDDIFPSYIQNSKAPRYFVFGPMCFEQVTAELATEIVKARGAGIALSGSPIANYLIDNTPKTPGEELVVLSHLFKNGTTAGYSPTTFSVVKSVNGQPVNSLRELAKALTESKDEYLTIAFFDKDAETLVFKRADMAKATEDVKESVGIVKPYSPDLADILKY